VEANERLGLVPEMLPLTVASLELNVTAFDEDRREPSKVRARGIVSLVNLAGFGRRLPGVISISK